MVLFLAPMEASYHVARTAGNSCLPAGRAPKFNKKQPSDDSCF